MVVFTCGHCGESVQKPKVEKHYLTKCRNRNPNLSCMDCFKDFFGQDYEAHNKCITEEERYSGKGYVSKEKKGEKKQNTWVEMLQSVLDEQKNAPGNVIKIIEAVSKHTNTPRKKPKFINFVKNVCGHKTNPKDIDQAWDFISVKLSALSNVNNRNQNQNKDETKEKGNEAKEKGNEAKEKDNELEINGTHDTSKVQNGNTIEVENGKSEDGLQKIDEKKLTKKQRKEEKKRQKYEAELQSVEAPQEGIEEEAEIKKGKKKKKKSESVNEEDSSTEGKNGKNKKRKRQDTVNSNSNGHSEPAENGTENGTDTTENVAPVKEKTQKKKQKMEEDEAEESLCLHDQNVAKIGELAVSGDKFNWHAVIMSVLEKKGNEVPFKRLQKKVLAEYSEATGRDVDDRIADKFIKKLKSAPNVRVDKNRVLLID